MTRLPAAMVSGPGLQYNASRYMLHGMIRSFKCSDTQALFAGVAPARFGNMRAVAERKLQMLHRAVRIEDLRVPPGNRLEKVAGDRAGTWSIRINEQWRLCFRFEHGDAFDVEIVDYH